MIKVVKFGGSSVANASQLEKVKNIIDSDPSRKFIVTSACGKEAKDDYKVTDLLYILYAHLKYKVASDDIFNMIIERYEKIKKDLNLKIDLSKEFNEIKKQLSDVVDEDYLVSRGEYLTAKLLAEYLDAKFVDAKDVIVFNYDKSINYEKTKEAWNKHVNTKKKIVFPGFYGAMPDGTIKVMSRGGSDITGAILANLLDADLYENWTDVSGILVCDPRIVNDPHRIRNITYGELREMSYMGANVLHDEAILPVKLKNIPINIRNTNNPDNPGTMIMESCAEADAMTPPFAITGITGKKGYTVITATKNHISSEVGFIRKMLTIFEKYNISIESCPAGVDSVSVIVETAYVKNYIYEILTYLKEELKCDEINTIDNIAQVAIVGRAMKNKKGMSGGIFGELGANDINIKTISQGSDEISIIVGVDNNDFEKAIKCLYKKFIE